MNDSKATQNDTKKLFMKLGTCSHTLFYVLNREFDTLKEYEGKAADPLAGGIAQRGHQCGMLWGATLAVGAEAFRRCNDRGQAIALAITASQRLFTSFTKRMNSVNCRDITGYDFTKKIELVKFMVKFFLHLDRRCFDLAEEWAPEAIRTATEALSLKQTDFVQQPVSCASEVAKKMGANDEEMVTVAGFAGGIGLSGNGCGALSAAIWMNTLAWCREHPGKSGYSNPHAKKIVQAFCDATNSEFLCHNIAGQRFQTIDEHTKFINNGGCEKLIDMLARL